MEQHWVALATTAENSILAWCSDLNTLEQACSGEFRAICRVYGVTGEELALLRSNKLNYKLQYIDARTTKFVDEEDRDSDTEILSKKLLARVMLTKELHQRLEHGYKRFQSLVPWQETAYLIKEEQARRVIKGDKSDIGFIQDEAEFRKLPLETIANLVIAKADNLKFQIMKLERIRIKTQMAINTIKTKEDVQDIRATLAEESFVSMLM
jgi:hypothetical protein|tara:strand:+ start:150 stop:779 length:630 start_codon:yes stop_codon:yes gene_type:complete